ncbi:MAG: DUF1080 domain-containing protein [Saprospiraceae bacterium]|nr:DUF1080 domain-containing protein [Saprospiraceae bacterium]
MFIGCGDKPASKNSESNIAKMEAGSKTIPLFNHQNLDGWYTFIKDRGRNKDPKNVFTVEDGVLHISGEEWGCITTEAEYENYHLIAEYKWGPITHEPRKDRARDGGILVHSVGTDGDYDGIWMYSIECQIIEGGTGDFIVVGDKSEKYSVTSPVSKEKQGSSYLYQPGGELMTFNSGRINWFGRDPNWKDELGFRGAQDIEKPVGDWNRMECIVSGDTIITKLNGIIVNEAYQVRPLKGRIQIQSESAEMFFRKIDMIVL